MRLITDVQPLPNIDPSRLTAEDRDGLALADWFRDFQPDSHDVVTDTQPLLPASTDSAFTLERRALRLHQRVTFDVIMRKIGDFLTLEDSLRWWMADLALMVDSFDEFAQLLTPDMDMNPRSFYNRRRVADVFPPEGRVWELGFWFYYEVRALPEDARGELLDRAERNGYSVADLRLAVQQWRAEYDDDYTAPNRCMVRLNDLEAVAAKLYEKLEPGEFAFLYEAIGALLHGEP